ncbi:hypothetical protein MRB53_008221 [Persea americana]|uniref:Uncharacterized protein n=1 Tax=Persea americana TaxID=3435 RepID=A0ACC2MLT8_PERAE|nr:hypothetical protein MRB53_008221 [Persea americana]
MVKEKKLSLSIARAPALSLSISNRTISLSSLEHIMASTVENIGEQHPQKHGQEDDSGVVVAEKRWPGWPGETVFRLLVPAQKVGGIIGRKGEFIKKMTEESRARIKILDGPPGTAERAVMISAKEEPDAPVPPAMDGLLKVHKRIIDVNETASARPNAGVTVTTRLLVAGSQVGSLIGRQGATVKSIQEASNCIIHVSGTEDLPALAQQDDRIIEIQGQPEGVHKAVELTASFLRKFLVDHSVLPLFENYMTLPNPHMDRNMPHPYWGYPHGPPPNAGASGFGGNTAFMPPGPPLQHDNYYPSSDLSPLDKQLQQGLPAFGRDVPVGFNPSTKARAPPPQMISQVTQHMQIPLSYADAVIGTAGATISYIRRASDATITIQETRGVPGEMTVEIIGSATQVQTAQQLIQNFMAEAGAPPAQNQVSTQSGSWQNPSGYADQGYHSFPSHGSMYASPRSNAGHAADHAGGYTGHAGGGYGSAGGNAGHTDGGYGSAGGNAGHTGGGYGSVYGTNYGY